MGKITLTRLSEIGSECKEKEANKLKEKRIQLEQAKTAAIENIRSRHLAEMKELYDLSDNVTVRCIPPADVNSWFVNPVKP